MIEEISGMSGSIDLSGLSLKGQYNRTTIIELITINFMMCVGQVMRITFQAYLFRALLTLACLTWTEKTPQTLRGLNVCHNWSYFATRLNSAPQYLSKDPIFCPKLTEQQTLKKLAWKKTLKTHIFQQKIFCSKFARSERKLLWIKR